MDQSKRSCFEPDQNEDKQKKSSEFDLEYYSFLSENNDHRPASGDDKNSSTEEGKLVKIPEKDVNSMDKERATDSTDENLITLNSLEPELDEKSGEADETVKDKKDKTKNDDEEEGTYEELICLVRQFYVEKPINPAALAHQNIETC